MNAPLPSEGLWFLSQYCRWGLLKTIPDRAYMAHIAEAVSQTAHYRAAASSLGLRTEPSEPHTSVLMDGRAWDGKDALAYAESFAIRV